MDESGRVGHRAGGNEECRSRHLFPRTEIECDMRQKGYDKEIEKMTGESRVLHEEETARQRGREEINRPGYQFDSRVRKEASGDYPNGKQSEGAH
jgi:hypothetical protein